MISPHEYLKSTIYHYLGQVFTDIDEDEVKVSCYMITTTINYTARSAK
jgi:hypothetical protein